ncbi:MAG: hypothetical protein FWE33_00825 [Defluviitaleaceae bacterium]|nr:hypothetical protein [Defluviitaleaceae bacterium]
MFSKTVWGDRMEILMIVWWLVTIVQTFLNYGTAYRLTRDNGNNGASLFAWMLLLSFAALIPGLCIFLWWKFRDKE